MKLPFVAYVLAMGTFLMGTTEFVVAGILPEIASDLHVTPARAGLLVTTFAVGMIVGAPVMAILTRKLPSRLTLILALLVFAAGHLVIAITSVFTIVLIARFLTAVATGAFWSVSMIVATRAAGSGAGARAVGMVVAGGTLANVAGVPIGAFVGQALGWRGPFWALAVLSALATLVIARQVPAEHADAKSSSLRAEFAGLRSGRMWLAMAGSAGIMGGVLSTYTFVTPLLTERSGVPEQLMPLVLITFGAGSLIGVTIGGRLGDAHPFRTTLIAASLTTALLALLAIFSGFAVPAVVLISLAALTGFAVNPITISLSVTYGKGAPNLAPALSTSAFNVGIASGSGLAGVFLESPLELEGPVTVGITFALITVVVLAILGMMERRRPQLPRGHADEQEEVAAAPAH
ncbi:MFS transporter [Curtobacterium sp. NPDC089689]|uniref:MFS transporter n=1 Tax=Curtobacterium sp. NPDC089689 TaxID=3363968 RepID=UPI00382839EC